MSQSKELANRFSEVMLNGKWIANTNFKEQLHNIDLEMANQQIGSLNTIALLTFHVNYYIEGVLNVLRGGALEIRDKYSFDLKPLQSEAEWKSLKKELLTNAEAFANEVAKMPKERLDSDFVDGKYGSYRKNIEGMIEHAYYHLGQITLIKKMTLNVDD